MAGFIYIFSNPSFDGRLKIGISLNDPSTEKLNKFNQLEVLPEPFAVEYYCFVEQHQNLMRDLEKEFNDFRPNIKRDYYILEIPFAINMIRKCADKYGGIKYENFANTNITVNKTNQIDDKTGVISSKDTFELLKLKYPKASLIIDYNDEAKKMYQDLSLRPGGGEIIFLSTLEKNPKIKHDELVNLYDEKFLNRFINPFSNQLANFYFDFLSLSDFKIAEDFLFTYGFLQDTISVEKIFNKLCDKYSIPELSQPKPEKILTKVSQKIINSFGTSNQKNYNLIKSILQTMGFSIAGYQKFGPNGRDLAYEISRDNLILTKTSTRDALYHYLAKDFSLISLENIYNGQKTKLDAEAAIAKLNAQAKKEKLAAAKIKRKQIEIERNKYIAEQKAKAEKEKLAAKAKKEKLAAQAKKEKLAAKVKKEKLAAKAKKAKLDAKAEKAKLDAKNEKAKLDAKAEKAKLDAKAEKAKLAAAALYNIKYRKNEEERLEELKNRKNEQERLEKLKNRIISTY